MRDGGPAESQRVIVELEAIHVAPRAVGSPRRTLRAGARRGPGGRRDDDTRLVSRPRRPGPVVWLRAFPDLARRAPALAAFYGGPVWAEHREAANATMIDSENVLSSDPPAVRQASRSIGARRSWSRSISSPSPSTMVWSSASSESSDEPGRPWSPRRAPTTSRRCRCARASTWWSGSWTGKTPMPTRYFGSPHRKSDRTPRCRRSGW